MVLLRWPVLNSLTALDLSADLIETVAFEHIVINFARSERSLQLIICGGVDRAAILSSNISTLTIE